VRFVLGIDIGGTNLVVGSVAEDGSALHALDRGRARESCEAFDSLRGADSLDAVAWLGLAYCEGLNQRVVRDPRSATGWVFEGNQNAAQFAYTQAVRIAPASFGAFSFENVVKSSPDGSIGRPKCCCRRVQTSHRRSMFEWCRKKIGSTGDRKLTMLPYGPGSIAPTPPIAL